MRKYFYGSEINYKRLDTTIAFCLIVFLITFVIYFLSVKFLYEHTSFMWVISFILIMIPFFLFSKIGLVDGIFLFLFQILYIIFLQIEAKDILYIWSKDTSKNYNSTNQIHLDSLPSIANFNEVTILEEFVYTEKDENIDGGTTMFYTACPLVDKNWGKDIPVNVWLVYNVSENEFYSPPKSIKSGFCYPKGSDNYDLYDIAINRSCELYQLKKTEKPILILWNDNPNEYIEIQKKIITTFLKYSPISIILLILLIRLGIYLKIKEHPYYD